MMFRRWAAAFLALAALAGAPCAIAAREAPQAVRDLAYGPALFAFFQDDYSGAGMELLVALHEDRLQHHREEAELLLGGMYLAYGVYADAEQIFNRMIVKGTTPRVRDRAWFYLAKSRYRKGLWDDAQTALGKISDTLPPALEDESRLMAANLSIRRREYDQAAKMLSRVRDGVGAAYGYYNLGAALSNAGQPAQGAPWLERVGALSAEDSEARALRDRANLALGYQRLGAEQPQQAQDFLQRVRLNGPFSDQALLGLGWADAAANRFDRALAPWQLLTQRDQREPAVLEAMLANAYALERLRAYWSALQSYREAITVYEAEQARLEQAVEAARNGALVRALLQSVPRDEAGESTATISPDTPEGRYLPQLLAEHRFHEALRDLRDVQRLRERLARWTDDMPAYQHMLALRRSTYEQRLPRIEQQIRTLDPAARRAQRDRAVAEIERIRREEDAPALATDEERAMLQRLSKVPARLERLGLAMDTREYLERYHLLQGLLEWDLRTDFKPRLWAVTRGLKELDQALEQTQAGEAALQQIRVQAPRGFKGYETRVVAMQARLARARQQADRVSGAQEAYLQRLALEALGRRQARLRAYLDEALLAVARIEDQAAAAPGRQP